ncbi:hypothetical protein CMO83_00075 [Candidatus Woesearchaeota archaeon]|jgi:hypothetical protein|nr:hypothetical protein [Candidatus Woesearchaeota archaeon]|tara:strand:+ start:46475 stop:46717 length:243 start_codon:yes stop_codon:yes gene_type:complete
MKPGNKQGPRFTLPSLEVGVTYWVDCELRSGSIAHVTVSPDKVISSIPDKLREVVTRECQRMRYGGEPEYSKKPLDLQPL